MRKDLHELIERIVSSKGEPYNLMFDYVDHYKLNETRFFHVDLKTPSFNLKIFVEEQVEEGKLIIDLRAKRGVNNTPNRIRLFLDNFDELDRVLLDYLL